MKKFSLLATVFAAVGLFSSAVVQAEIKPVTLKFAHIYAAQDHWGQTAERFKAAVEERSGGKIKINIDANGLTGDWPQSIEGLRMGTNHIVLQSVGALDRYAKSAGVEAYPYLIRDMDHYRAVYNGTVGQELYEQITKESGFKLVGAAYRGARYLTSNRLIQNPDDLHGLKMRVPPLRMYRSTWTTLGASPVPMGMAELFTSLQHGMIDGQENPLEVIKNVNLFEVQKNVAETQHTIGAMTLIYSDAYFKKLPEETRQILQEEGERVMKEATDRMIVEEENMKQFLIGKGMAFNTVDREAFATKIQAMDAEFPELQVWLDKIRAVQ